MKLTNLKDYLLSNCKDFNVAIACNVRYVDYIEGLIKELGKFKEIALICYGNKESLNCSVIIRKYQEFKVSESNYLIIIKDKDNKEFCTNLRDVLNRLIPKRIVVLTLPTILTNTKSSLVRKRRARFFNS